MTFVAALVRSCATLCRLMRSAEGKERIRFTRRTDFRDVELLRTQNTPRTWSVFNLDFSFAILRSWNGHVQYRRRRLRAGPGEIFCSEPGEVHCAIPSGVEGVGSFDVLQVQPGIFEAQCRADGLRPVPHFAAMVAQATARLGGALDALQAALIGDASSLELQSRLTVLINACVEELVEAVPRPRRKLAARAAVERLRDVLHSSDGSRIRLIDFAEEAGVSPFKLLRSFKNTYGLPPHAYELIVRMHRARHMLRAGYSAAEAAAANDFTDQSHLHRHFRRLWGMTPGQYLRYPDTSLTAASLSVTPEAP